jgi:hypothetical protein
MANKEILALSLSGQGASVNGNDMDNVSGRSAVVVADLTAISGGNATFTLEGKDPHSGKYYTIIAGAATTITTPVIMRVGAGLTAAANLVVNDIMPRTWRVTYTRGTSALTTATVSVLLVD